MVLQITIKKPFSAKYKNEWKTPIGETGCLGNPYFLPTGCLGIQFLIHRYANTVSYAAFG